MRIAPSEITSPQAFFNRREILAAGLAAAGAAVASAAPAPQSSEASLRYMRNPRYSLSVAPNSFEDITSHNNFYELGTGTSAPKRNAGSLRTRPWSVTVAGEAELTGTFTLEDVLAPHALEERIYRFRCVERWSMVVPWLGFPLGAMLKRFKPTSRAKYVELTTLLDPRQLPGQRYPVLEWPYVEGLRIDEAMHPLTLMVTGVYGRTLPNQNGAPLRLIVPWKYGFKSIKSIVKIRFTERPPRTSWNLLAPDEYGFYSNVNPDVDHPRWSQAKERRIGAGFLTARRPTLLFNGYANEIAGLYRGMDLRRFF
ncbi:MAG: protein-methionine-sulfoxide reductase catalytic subunit MsrP [Steroidobacteraceae bacterium]